MIYFLHSPTQGAVKIGYAAYDVAARIRSLQAGNPAPLRLLGSVAGTPADERRLHRRFASWRLNGEWFRADEVLLAHVGELVATYAASCTPVPERIVQS